MPSDLGKELIRGNCVHSQMREPRNGQVVGGVWGRGHQLVGYVSWVPTEVGVRLAARDQRTCTLIHVLLVPPIVLLYISMGPRLGPEFGDGRDCGTRTRMPGLILTLLGTPGRFVIHIQGPRLAQNLGLEAA